MLALLAPSNQLIMQVCLHTGLRVGDVLALRRDQIKPRFWVTEAKTGKRRLVGLPAELRDKLTEGGGVWCFPGRDDPTKHRTRQAVWRDVKKAARALGLRQNVGPHSFRKVYAVDLLRKYGDLAKVRRCLRHSRDSVTMIYALADVLLEAKQGRKVYRAGVR